MEGASLGTKAMDNGRRTAEGGIERKLYGENGELGDESLEGG